MSWRASLLPASLALGGWLAWLATPAPRTAAELSSTWPTARAPEAGVGLAGFADARGAPKRDASDVAPPSDVVDVTGTVKLLPEGEPLAGATVYLLGPYRRDGLIPCPSAADLLESLRGYEELGSGTAWQKARTWAGDHTATTDPDGTFRIRASGRGSILLMALHPRAAFTSVVELDAERERLASELVALGLPRVTVTEGETSACVLRLPRFVQVRGTLSDEDGTFVTRLGTVYWQDAHGGPLRLAAALWPDELGRFEFDLGPGDYRIWPDQPVEEPPLERTWAWTLPDVPTLDIELRQPSPDDSP